MIEAQTALRGGDDRRAERLWDEAITQYPKEATQSPLAIHVLLGLKRFDDAEALMNKGQKERPNDIRYAVGLAQTARARGDLELAIRRAALVRKRSQNVPEGYSIAIQSLRDLSRFAEAEVLTIQAMARVPNDVLVFMEHARLADAQQNWEESIDRWGAVKSRFDHSGGYMGTANAMIKLGRFDEAEVLLTQARTRFPTDVGPGVGLAQVAQARGDASEATIRWQRLAQRFPLDMVIVLLAVSNLLKLNAIEKAIELLRDAVDHFPTEPRPRTLLTEALSRLHRTDTEHSH